MYLRSGIPHSYSIHIRVLEDGRYRRLVGGNVPGADDYDVPPPLPSRGDLVSYLDFVNDLDQPISWMGRVDDVEYYYGGYDNEAPVQDEDVEAMVLITLYLTPLSQEEFDRYNG